MGTENWDRVVMDTADEMSVTFGEAATFVRAVIKRSLRGADVTLQTAERMIDSMDAEALDEFCSELIEKVQELSEDDIRLVLSK